MDMNGKTPHGGLVFFFWGGGGKEKRGGDVGRPQPIRYLKNHLLAYMSTYILRT